MSGEDIYPLIPPVHFRQFRTPFARSVIPLVLLVILWQLYASRGSSFEPALTSSSSSDLPPEHARPRPVLPQTPTQQANEQRLRLLIDSTRSAFDPALWSTFKLPPYSPLKPTQRLYADNEADAPGEGIVITGHVPVTAVLLSWKRKRGLDLVVEMIAKHPFVREIIIWNNDIQSHLSPSEFIPLFPSEKPPHLRIFNAPANVHDFAKHTACSLATYSTCYFNDDDWLNVYMDSLYTKYIDTGGESNPRIITNTMPIIHLEHRRWRFVNPDIDMHTGFAWLGTGAFVPKVLSLRFLQQMSSLPTSLVSPSNSGPLVPDQTSLCDMYFSIWTNTWPEQSPNELVPIDVEGAEVGWSRGKGVDQWATVYANILDAIRRLYDVLDSRDPYLSPYPFHRSMPQPVSDARSPCFNDDCLFLTSFNPFPSPSDLTYPSLKTKSWIFPPWAPRPPKRPRPSTNSKLIARFDPLMLDHIKEHEALFNAVDKERKGIKIKWPTDAWWTKKGSWHIAVNGKEDECWDSGRPPRRGDFVGLHFVEPRDISQVIVIGGAALKGVGDSDATSSWEVQTLSATSKDWVVRSFVDQPKVFIRPSGVIESSFTLSPERGTGSKLVKKIRLVARKTGDLNIEVCGWEVDGWTT